MSDDFIDKVIKSEEPKKSDKGLVGVYLEPDLAKILDGLLEKGGRGTKSEIVNLALRKLFKEKGLLNEEKNDVGVKPIRPTVLEFETEGEMQEFIDYALSKEKTNSPELNKLRELMKNHVPSKRRED